MQPVMSGAERECYEALLDGTQSIVEFGSGGSTLLALDSGATRIVSVDSDRGWLAGLRDETRTVEAEDVGRLTLVHAHIGPVGQYGAPTDQSQRARWPDYALAPWEFCAQPDLVLVDGRFRVACIAQAVLHCRGNGLIAVHDFWNRPAYHGALRVLEWVSSTETFGIFKPRRWSGHAARTLFQAYKFTSL